MASTYRIHPAFGVARVGDSEKPGFLGPETPGVPANWDLSASTFKRFKDDDGRVLRQGVRFRVFEFDDAGNAIGEAIEGTRGVSAVEWAVHVANRKASFFEFHGQAGAAGDFSSNGARNSSVQGAARRTLEIDPGQQRIAGRSQASIPLTNANPLSSGTIPTLGEISTDPDGHLLFFGAGGRTLQQPGAPDIADYVNNDGWFDDVSDGPISATVVLQDGSRVEAASAWVAVGPPDFAPALQNVVTLFETMWDIAVRHAQVPIPNLAMFRPGGVLERLAAQRGDWDAAANRFRTYKPSFVGEIADILFRAFSATYTHAPPDVKGAFHNTIASHVWKDLGDPDPAKAGLRREVFQRMRDPNATGGADSNKMPRGLGDEYCDENDARPGSAERNNSKRFFSLTPTQYAMLAQWAAGVFDADGVAPKGIPQPPGAVTPEGLDRAALENCVGGPFFPGIEVSWLVRAPSIYAEPFRVRLGVKVAKGDPGVGIDDVATRPGFFTQQMALPWQADFRDCKREKLTRIPPLEDGTTPPTYAMWWAAQRPDDVFPEGSPDQQVPWTRAPHFTAGDDDDARFKDMVRGWATLGFIARRIGKKWVETERKP